MKTEPASPFGWAAPSRSRFYVAIPVLIGLIPLSAWTAPAQQPYLKASNTSSNALFGESVAVYGNTVVIGTPGESSNATGVNGDQSNDDAPYSGAAYVFLRSGTNWSQEAYLKPSNTGARNNFGWSVAVSGDTVVVGATGESSNATGVNGNQSDSSAPRAGAAYVFVRTGTNWSQQAYLKASNTDAADVFGRAVAVSGDTIVIGAPDEDSSATGVNGNQSDNSSRSSGAAYIFVRRETTWTQQAYLKASNGEAGDWFGYSVAVSGDTVVVGAGDEDSSATGVNGNQSDNSASSAGAAYVFVRTGTNWSQQAYLKASNCGPADRFGISVGVSGDTAVVGAPNEDSGSTGVNGNQGDDFFSSDSGAAYVFLRSGSNWSQQAYLKASNTGSGDAFGVRVAVSGDLVVVGANLEPDNGPFDSASNEGAAYVFMRIGTNFLQKAYLKASNREAGDSFGWSVAVSGDTVVGGAAWEDSSAVGVNANPDDNSASDSGAAYVFDGFGVRTKLAIIPDTSSGYFLRYQGIPDLTSRLQRATDVMGPWCSIATNIAHGSGVIEYHDVCPLIGQGFYRSLQP